MYNTHHRPMQRKRNGNKIKNITHWDTFLLVLGNDLGG